MGLECTFYRLSPPQMEALQDEGDGNIATDVSFEIGPDWEELNGFFCGKDKAAVFPNNFIVSGKPLVEIDEFEGDDVMVPRWFSVEEVASIACFLNTLNQQKFVQKYSQNSDKQSDYLGSLFDELREFFNGAEKANDFVVVMCC